MNNREEDLPVFKHNLGIQSNLATNYCGVERLRYNDGTVPCDASSSSLPKIRKKRHNRSAANRLKRKQNKLSSTSTKEDIKTETNTIKDFCYNYKSEDKKSLSSQRTQAAALWLVLIMI